MNSFSCDDCIVSFCLCEAQGARLNLLWSFQFVVTFIFFEYCVFFVCKATYFMCKELLFISLLYEFFDRILYLFTACSLSKLLLLMLFFFVEIQIHAHKHSYTYSHQFMCIRRGKCRRNYVFRCYFYGCCNLIYVNKWTGEMVCILILSISSKWNAHWGYS